MIKGRGDRTFDTGEVARLRQGLYRFFAASLLYPDRERLATLVMVAQEFDGLEVFAFYGAWRRLTNALQSLRDSDVVAIEEAYDRFFSMSTDGTLSPPHESFYLAPPGQATGFIIARLEREYGRLGLTLSGDMRNSPDHASVEMEVMAFLCDREADAWERRMVGDVAQALRHQHDFLTQHLGQWFPLFTRRVTEMAPGDLYSLVGEAANAFIHHERDYLNFLRGTLQEESTEGGYASA